jgi:glycosyltransferase involved in cell wall biosynthesis
VKLTLVTETYPPEVNGVAMTLRRLTEGLAERHHQIEVIRPRLGRADRPTPGTNPAAWPVPGLPLPYYSELRIGLPVAWRLRRRWRAAPPDVVHVATEGPLGWAALLVARRLRLPVSSSFHTNFHHYTQHYIAGFTRVIALAWLRSFHNRAGCTLVPTDQAKAELEALGFARVGVLSRGVDTVLFDPARRSAALRASWGAGPDDPVCLYVGRLAVEKNIQLAVEAFAAVREREPRAKFVLVGDGPARAGRARRDPDFHYAGLRRGEDLAAHYASGDVFLFPSTTETFGNVVTEAMGAGLVTLCFDYAAGRQHIRPWHNGVLAPFGDAPAFRAAAVEIFARRAEWPALRAAARKTALGIGWNRIFDVFERALQDVIAAAAAEQGGGRGP